MSWPSDKDDSDLYAFEPERFLVPPMEGFLRRILGARWGLILVSASHSVNLPVILEFLANFSLQQVYYSSFSAEQGDFHELKGERRRLRTIDEVLDEARKAMDAAEEEGLDRPDVFRFTGQPYFPTDVSESPKSAEFRHDVPQRRTPDLVFIPELKEEYVMSAVEFALNARLVVSGIRAEGSFLALRHVVDLLGHEYLVASSLIGILGLNTVEKICEECKVRVEYELSEEDVILIGGQKNVLTGYKGMGCEACDGTGYRGRILIHEGLEMTPAIREAILKGTPPRQLRMLAKRDGMTTLLDATWMLAEAGETTLDEVVRMADATDPGKPEMKEL